MVGNRSGRPFPVAKQTLTTEDSGSVSRKPVELFVDRLVSRGNEFNWLFVYWSLNGCLSDETRWSAMVGFVRDSSRDSRAISASISSISISDWKFI